MTMTKSIEEQATDYAEQSIRRDNDENISLMVKEFKIFIRTAFLVGVKRRDAEWIKVVNELKGALTKSKDTLQELNSDFGTFFYEDGSEETEQEVKDTYDHVDKTLIKADQMMKEMGISL